MKVPEIRKVIYHNEIDKCEHKVVNTMVEACYYPNTKNISISSGILSNGRQNFSAMMSCKIGCDLNVS